MTTGIGGESWWPGQWRQPGTGLPRLTTILPAVYQTFARPGVWELCPDVPPVLTELSRLRLRLGVISNFDRRLYDILGHLQVRDVI